MDQTQYALLFMAIMFLGALNAFCTMVGLARAVRMLKSLGAVDPEDLKS